MMLVYGLIGGASFWALKTNWFWGFPSAPLPPASSSPSFRSILYML